MHYMISLAIHTSSSALKGKKLSMPTTSHTSKRKKACVVSAFSEFHHHQFSDCVPFSSWSVDVSGIHIFSDPGPRNDQGPAGNLFANTDTSVALAAIHSFALSLIPHMMSLSIDMKIIRPWYCSGPLILFMNFWILGRAALK